jgi:GxxExxY protein
MDAAYKVHKAFGPGLLENAYEICLVRELKKRNLKVDRQIPVPLIYNGETIDAVFRIDLLAQDQLIVEIEAVEKTFPLHEAQLLTYLKITGLRLGLLINFNVRLIKDGIKRIVL